MVIKNKAGDWVVKATPIDESGRTVKKAMEARQLGQRLARQWLLDGRIRTQFKENFARYLLEFGSRAVPDVCFNDYLSGASNAYYVTTGEELKETNKDQLLETLEGFEAAERKKKGPGITIHYVRQDKNKMVK
jgi:hypothetical protein